MNAGDLAKLLETHLELTEQVEQLSRLVLKQMDSERVNNLRDLLLWKIVISEIADENGSIKLRLQKRLDILLLSIGDDKAMCEAIAKAHAVVEGAN